jgi:hypothetical protein
MMNRMSAVALPARTRPGRRRTIGLLVALFVLWLAVGVARAPTIAAAAFNSLESPNLATDVTATPIPIVPPFFIVSTAGRVWLGPDVGSIHTLGYLSAQFFLVEPFTGWTINLSQLGLAPSA